MDLCALTESDICDQFITPAIHGAGWDAESQIRREVTYTAGRIWVRGRMASRSKKRKRADYVLSYRPGLRLAVKALEVGAKVEGDTPKAKQLPPHRPQVEPHGGATKAGLENHLPNHANQKADGLRFQRIFPTLNRTKFTFTRCTQRCT